MTQLERIRNDRTWRGATVEEVEWNGRPAWRLTHPRGAVAHVYKGAGSVQVRHQDAYRAACAAHKWLSSDLPRVARRLDIQKEYRKAIAHFEHLSGMKMEIFP